MMKSQPGSITESGRHISGNDGKVFIDQGSERGKWEESFIKMIFLKDFRSG
jgi:hypothetical protein